MRMEEEYKLSLEIIKEIREYLERKDYSGLRLYLDEKEKYVENCSIFSKTEEEKYIDGLIKELDNN